MELVFTIGVLVVLAASLAGNVFQALRYDALVRRLANPPDGYLEEHAVQAAVRGDTATAVALAHAGAAKRGVPIPEREDVQIDRSITP